MADAHFVVLASHVGPTDQTTDPHSIPSQRGHGLDEGVEPPSQSILRAWPCLIAMRPWLLTRLTWRGALAWQLLDDDHSGRIAYSELSMGLRQELGMSRKDLPEEELQALWNALDEDSSGFISAGEFVRFVKRGAAGLPEAAVSQYVKAKKNTQLRVNLYEDEWEEEAE